MLSMKYNPKMSKRIPGVSKIYEKVYGRSGRRKSSKKTSSQKRKGKGSGGKPSKFGKRNSIVPNDAQAGNIATEVYAQ